MGPRLSSRRISPMAQLELAHRFLNRWNCLPKRNSRPTGQLSSWSTRLVDSSEISHPSQRFSPSKSQKDNRLRFFSGLPHKFVRITILGVPVALLRVLFCLILCSGWLGMAMSSSPPEPCGLCLDCDGTFLVKDSKSAGQLVYFYAASNGP